ncbi:MAG TPA: guanylate kinase [Candidatus Baltobacteraceae bacterium]|nr:guanylate kinase [Candidatus Baltobacteraceae bacterium]
MQGPGLLFVVSGPSGAGKDTVVEGLRRRMPQVRYSVSATTRPPREHERSGEAYFFLDRPAFEQKRALGDFLETKEYNGHLYGTPRSFVEETLAAGYDVIVKPEVTGALAIKRAFPAAVLVFLLPDRFSYLQQRLTERRTESAEEIAARLAIAHHELEAIRDFDYVIINAQASPETRDALPAAADLEAVVRAERFRIHHYKDDDFRNLAQS